MSDDQFTQLSQAIERQSQSINRKFKAVDKRFEAMDKKFDTQFMKLFRYMNKEFGKIHAQLDQKATKAELNTYANAVDAYMKRTEVYHHEMLALGHKVDRHERWHHQTAKAVGIKLKA